MIPALFLGFSLDQKTLPITGLKVCLRYSRTNRPSAIPYAAFEAIPVDPKELLKAVKKEDEEDEVCSKKMDTESSGDIDEKVDLNDESLLTTKVEVKEEKSPSPGEEEEVQIKTEEVDSDEEDMNSEGSEN